MIHPNRSAVMVNQPDPKTATAQPQSTSSTRPQEHDNDWQGVVDNPWRRLRQFTAARIGLGRSGVSLPTRELLAFQLAHAQARDAVHTPLDFEQLSQQLEAQAEEYPVLNQQPPLRLHSEAIDRPTYLQRPDLGRTLDQASRVLLKQEQAAAADTAETAFDLAIVIADGLSATAIASNAAAFIGQLCQQLQADQRDWSLAPITLVEQGRVAIGDDVGELLNARMVLMLIGERPGLSSPDSLGLYLTFAPQTGLTDARRNCISNVRPQGLNYSEAASKALYLMQEAQRLQLSGVDLKDRSGNASLENDNTALENDSNVLENDNHTIHNQNFLLR
jgi:ethanolamine ammonia-lyase small subunit